MNARVRRPTHRVRARASWTPSLALSDAGVRPSKGKGQNFLVQPAIASRIVAAADLSAGDEVIEIGPGLGILSERIAAHPVRRVWLVEIDPRLADNLKRRFKSAPNVEIVQADFLDLQLADLARGRVVKVIGNLPFNAAGAMLRKLCESRSMVARMVLMFQREVAERIRARPGDAGYAMLSVMSALYWEIDAHFRVGAGNFHPRPKVDAEVLVFKPRAESPFEPGEEMRLLDTIRAAFSARRKTLRNALSGALGLAPARVEDSLKRAAIDPNARAETLGVADFVRLARALSSFAPSPNA